MTDIEYVGGEPDAFVLLNYIAGYVIPVGGVVDWDIDLDGHLNITLLNCRVDGGTLVPEEEAGFVWPASLRDEYVTENT